MTKYVEISMLTSVCCGVGKIYEIRESAFIKIIKEALTGSLLRTRKLSAGEVIWAMVSKEEGSMSFKSTYLLRQQRG
jgi:hypothetical protein